MKAVVMWVRSWAERLIEYLVGLCYGLTIGYVLVALACGVRDGLRQVEDGQSASDRYAASSGFDPIELKRAMQRAQDVLRGKPPNEPARQEVSTETFRSQDAGLGEP